MLTDAGLDIERRAAAGDIFAQLELASLLDGSGEHEAARIWLERRSERQAGSADAAWRADGKIVVLAVGP